MAGSSADLQGLDCPTFFFFFLFFLFLSLTPLISLASDLAIAFSNGRVTSSRWHLARQSRVGMGDAERDGGAAEEAEQRPPSSGDEKVDEAARRWMRWDKVSPWTQNIIPSITVIHFDWPFPFSPSATKLRESRVLDCWQKRNKTTTKKGEAPAVTCSVLENQSVCGQNRQVGPFTWTRSIKKKKTSDYFIDVDLKTCASILTPTNKWTFAIADCLKVFLRRAYLRNICPLSTRTFWKVAGKSNSSSPRLASPHRKRSWPRITFRCKCQLHFPIIWHHTCRWLPTRVHGHHFPHALGEQNLTRTFKNHTFTHPRPAVKLITQT